jgi:integrase
MRRNVWCRYMGCWRTCCRPCLTIGCFLGLTVSMVTKEFAKFRAELGIDRPGLVFHSTRKWFITQCERTGVPEHFTASLVGHQSARSENRLTYGIYSAGISDEQKRAIVDGIRLPCHP